MAHKCKCLYCGIEFDRDKLPYVQVTERRYAHKECAARNEVEKSQSEKDYEALIKYIDKIFGGNYVTAKVIKQIKDYKQINHYTYSGMYWALVYWYEVKKEDKDKAHGAIGIMPYIYEDAKKYYSKISAANNLNADVKDYKAKVIEIVISSPQREQQPPRLFDLGEESNGEIC